MNSKWYKAVCLAKQDILHIHDTVEDSIKEIHHYKDEFPKEIDYNIAEFGNVRIYYDDCREFFRQCGFKSADKLSDNAIWLRYKWYIGQAADRI